MGGAEVGAVAGERQGPLLSGVLEIFGDQGRTGFGRTPGRQKSASRHTRAVRQPERARQLDDSRLGWLRRRPANRWIGVAIPGLALFGVGFVLRILFGGDELGLYTYGVMAALAAVSLVVGLLKERKAH